MYALLYTYSLAKRFDRPAYMICNKAINDFNLLPALEDLNLRPLLVTKEEYFEIRKNKFAAGGTADLVQNDVGFDHAYHQQFGVDFDLETLEEFIRDTIVQSPALTRVKRNIEQFVSKDQSDDFYNAYAVYVRNGDYLGPNSPFVWFDRNKYFRSALERFYFDGRFIPTSYDLWVVSDDTELSKRLYNRTFAEFYAEDSADADARIHYISGQSAVEDLLTLALIKNKVILNSTFSYWAAFIGNVIWPDTYEYVISPAYFRHGQYCTTNDQVADHCNPLWRILHV